MSWACPHALLQLSVTYKALSCSTPMSINTRVAMALQGGCPRQYLPPMNLHKRSPCAGSICKQPSMAVCSRPLTFPFITFKPTNGSPSTQETHMVQWLAYWIFRAASTGNLQRPEFKPPCGCYFCPFLPSFLLWPLRMVANEWWAL